MSEEKNQSEMPAELHARLEQEDPDEREALSLVWQLLGERDQEAASPPPDTEAAWAALQQQRSTARQNGEAPASVRQRHDRAARSRPRRAAARVRWMAAALLVAALIGGLLFWRQPVEVVAPAGERVSVALPDGSTVLLDGGSTLTYRRGFQALPLLVAEERRTTVEGEALFTIAEEERPFLVETFNARIEVLGTQFEVQAWPRVPAPETQVTLAEGRLRLAARALPDEAVLLDRPGQSSRIAGASSAPTAAEDVDVDPSRLWQDRGFFASDQPLTVILDRLERRFGVPITLEAEAVGNDAMSLYYPQQTDLESVLRDICMAKGLKYQPTSRGYALVEDEAASN